MRRFYTLMVLSTALFGKPAFRNLICNGLVLAEDGKKMSKRLKNYPSPMEVINDYGAVSNWQFILLMWVYQLVLGSSPSRWWFYVSPWCLKNCLNLYGLTFCRMLCDYTLLTLQLCELSLYVLKRMEFLVLWVFFVLSLASDSISAIFLDGSMTLNI